MVLACRPRCAAMEKLRSHFGHLKEPGVISDSPFLDSRHCETPHGVNFPVGCTADASHNLPQGVSPPPPQRGINYAHQSRIARGFLWKNKKKGNAVYISDFPVNPDIRPSNRLLCQTQTEHQMPSRAICRFMRATRSFSGAARGRPGKTRRTTYTAPLRPSA